MDNIGKIENIKEKMKEYEGQDIYIEMERSNQIPFISAQNEVTSGQ